MELPKQTRLGAFTAAFNGLRKSMLREVHMRIHGMAAIVCLTAAWYFNICSMQLVIVLLCIVLVMAAELFNTAIEKICDLVQPEWDSRIGYIKDISSAAVLLCALFAFVCGLIIFLPPLAEMWFK